jgi:hypothetical protein
MVSVQIARVRERACVEQSLRKTGWEVEAYESLRTAPVSAFVFGVVWKDNINTT